MGTAEDCHGNRNIYLGCHANLHWPPSVYNFLLSAYDSIWPAVPFGALTSAKRDSILCVVDFLKIFLQYQLHCETFGENHIYFLS